MRHCELHSFLHSPLHVSHVGVGHGVRICCRIFWMSITLNISSLLCLHVIVARQRPPVLLIVCVRCLRSGSDLLLLIKLWVEPNRRTHPTMHPLLCVYSFPAETCFNKTLPKNGCLCDASRKLLKSTSQTVNVSAP
jgi:hypothetical protein